MPDKRSYGEQAGSYAETSYHLTAIDLPSCGKIRGVDKRENYKKARTAHR
ncbi:MAG: hypothetical protein GY850_43780 [bacterium]|nr:hypothetical protein [bacterium]